MDRSIGTEPARGSPISGDRCAELRGLFDGSRIDEDPARWAEGGELRLFLKGGGTEVYNIYSTRERPGPMPIISVGTSGEVPTPPSRSSWPTPSKPQPSVRGRHCDYRPGVIQGVKLCFLFLAAPHISWANVRLCSSRSQKTNV